MFCLISDYGCGSRAHHWGSQTAAGAKSAWENEGTWSLQDLSPQRDGDIKGRAEDSWFSMDPDFGSTLCPRSIVTHLMY